MADVHGLTVSLKYSGLKFEEHLSHAREGLVSAAQTAARLDATEATLDSAIADLGIQVPGAESPSPFRFVESRGVEDTTYRGCLNEAESYLRNRGCDIAALEPSDLLDEAAYRRLRRRFEVGFTLKAHLDKYDVGFLFLAGLVGSLVDWLFVKVPTKGGFLGAPSRDPSPMTTFLREKLAMASDNPLAKRFQAAYDAMPSEVPGMNPQMHRLHALGHDPLVGMAVGVFDILRGGTTIIDGKGSFHVIKGVTQPIYNPVNALFRHLGHLLSDAFTPMGLPAPGWSLLNLFSGGPKVQIGNKDRTISELAQIMYRQGYDLRHFFTMATATAAVEIALAGYFIFRTKADDSFRESQERQISEAGGRSYLASERYTAMSLLAHLIVASSNGIRIAAQGPIALNYPEWLRFLAALGTWISRRMRNPSDILLAGIDHNSKLIMRGWGALDDDSDPMPRADQYLL